MNNIENSNILAFSELLQNILKQDVKENLLDNEEDIPTIEIRLPEEDHIDEREPNEENIIKETDEKIYGDDINTKKDMDYCKLYDKFMGCKCDDDCRCGDIRKCDCKCKCDDIYKCDSIWDDDKCKWYDDCKYSNSSNVFYPVCCNGICTVPRMDNIKMIAEGQGIIAADDPEPEEPGQPGEEPEENGDIAFKFFIGKKHSKYVGNLSIVNFGEEIFISSEKLECYHSGNNTKFVAIFHVEELNGKSREIALYVTTQICNIAPTVFVYSAPHCGEDDELAMGGSVTSGTVVIADKCADDEAGMAH